MSAGEYFYLPFTEKKAEAQRCEITYLRPHSQCVVKLTFENTINTETILALPKPFACDCLLFQLLETYEAHPITRGSRREGRNGDCEFTLCQGPARHIDPGELTASTPPLTERVIGEDTDMEPDGALCRSSHCEAPGLRSISGLFEVRRAEYIAPAGRRPQRPEPSLPEGQGALGQCSGTGCATSRAHAYSQTDLLPLPTSSRSSLQRPDGASEDLSLC